MALRFDPPDLPLSPELRWLLAATFGPPDRWPGPGDSEATCVLAETLDLTPRLVTRTGAATLEEKLGASVAGRLLASYRRSAVGQLQIEGLVRLVAREAERLGTSMAVLKFAALRLGGHTKAGARGAADADVLVPRRAARVLRSSLVDLGYRSVDEPEYEHQLPALVHPSGATLEIHKVVLGVRPSGNRSATYEELERLSLFTNEGGCRVPSLDVLRAHALAHGIGQHGLAPQSYPLLRMVADLLDLGVAEPDLDVPIRWLRGSVSSDEVFETAALCRALSAGDLESLSSPRAPGSRLLRHILLGALEPAYGRSLTLRRVRRPLTDRPAPLRLASAAWSALWPTAGQMEAIYGPSRSRSERLWRRVRRPLDLLRRLAPGSRG